MSHHDVPGPHPKQGSKARALPALAVGTAAIGPLAISAMAVGAIAVGAIAVGAVAIGKLGIGWLVVKRGQFGSLEVDALTVRELRVARLIVDEES